MSDDPLAWLRDGVGHAECMSHAIDLEAKWSRDYDWDALRAIDWDADLEGTVIWLRELLASEPPPADVTGFWWGVFEPIRDDGVAYDFYLSGSTVATKQDEWYGWTHWWPEGRYRHSHAQAQLYRRADKDPILALVHALSSAVHAIQAVPRDLLLGESDCRQLAGGHDGGDAVQVATITPYELTLHLSYL